MADSSARRFLPNAPVLQRTVGNEHVLYNPDTDEVHTLDAVGSIVWDLLVEHLELDELVAVLADRFGQPRHVIAGDVVALLTGLEQAGLVTAVHAETHDISADGSSPDSPG